MLFSSVWNEPFGLTLIESLACGTPVIAFEGGAVEEILNARCGFTVPNGDVKAMAKAAGKLTDIARRACRAEVESRFSYQVMVDNYLDIYDTLITEHTYRKKFLHDRILRA